MANLKITPAQRDALNWMLAGGHAYRRDGHFQGIRDQTGNVLINLGYIASTDFRVERGITIADYEVTTKGTYAVALALTSMQRETLANLRIGASIYVQDGNAHGAELATILALKARGYIAIDEKYLDLAMVGTTTVHYKITILGTKVEIATRTASMLD